MFNRIKALVSKKATPTNQPSAPNTMASPPNSSPPVFIGGFRSGTTLLINLLGLHPQATPWFETKWLAEALRFYRVKKDASTTALESEFISPPSIPGFALAQVAERMRTDLSLTAKKIQGDIESGKAKHERYAIGHDHALYSEAEGLKHINQWEASIQSNDSLDNIRQANRQLILGLAHAHLQASGKARWINKTPEITRLAPELRDVFQQPVKTIYMVRNGLHVVESARKLGWAGVETLARNWVGLLDQSREVMASEPHNYLEIRYEDLLAQPELVLKQVAEFLGLDTQPAAMQAMLAGIQAVPLDTSRTQVEVALSPEEAQAFEAMCGERMREFGYR